MVLSTQKQLYDEQGFVVVPNLVPEASRAALEAACERVVERTRSGEWTLRRTVGRQFPPFDESNDDSWGVQHVMHPDLRTSASSAAGFTLPDLFPPQMSPRSQNGTRPMG